MNASKDFLVIVGAALLLTCTGAAQATPLPKQTTIATFEHFTEAPVFDNEGNLFVAHGQDEVIKLQPNGKRSVWAKLPHPGGHKIQANGNHVVCVQGAVLELDVDGRTVKTLATTCGGQPLRAPNDLTLDGQGGFYFTDPGGSREAPVGTVCHVNANGDTALVAGGLWVPNGLALDEKAKRLYVAETVPNRLLYFDVLPSLRLGPVNILARLPNVNGKTEGPDGLALDRNGVVYVAQLGSGTIQVVSARGQVVEALNVEASDASNLTWDPHGRELYITGSTGHRSVAPGVLLRLPVPSRLRIQTVTSRNLEKKAHKP